MFADGGGLVKAQCRYTGIVVRREEAKRQRNI